jgi:isoamylase
VGRFASRLAGSSDIFAARRGPLAGVNFVTAHDGFTLEDMVCYEVKHNAANGERNADGTSENFSCNFGVEGPTLDPEILGRRTQAKRNLIASLFLSQGVPMFLMGDEFGRSQGGNNNAYCQDNDIAWLKWPDKGEATDFPGFVRRLIELRKQHPAFRQKTHFTGEASAETGAKDIVWLAAEGREMTGEDWNAPHRSCLGARIDRSCDEGAAGGARAFLILANASPETVPFALPVCDGDRAWRLLFDTADANAAEDAFAAPGSYPLKPLSLALFTEAQSEKCEAGFR